jgi:hypothetical protein
MPTYEDHPFSTIWPLLEGEEFDKLVTEIQTNGLSLPILLYRDKILHDRNLYRAALAADVTAIYEQVETSTDEEALDLIVSLNNHEHQLSYEQRAFAAARLADMRRSGEGATLNAEKTNSLKKPFISSEDARYYHHHNKSLMEAAAIMGVTPAATKRARAVLTYGGEQLEKEVVARKISLTKATEKVRPKRAAKLIAGRSAKKTALELLHERTAAQLKSKRVLTPTEVDPEFTGTPMEFTTKYGHVQVETAEERARGRFSDWSIGMGHLAKVLDQQQLPKEVDLNWLRSPEPVYVERMRNALPRLRDMIQRAEQMLVRAEAALAASREEKRSCGDAEPTPTA